MRFDACVFILNKKKIFVHVHVHMFELFEHLRDQTRWILVKVDAKIRIFASIITWCGMCDLNSSMKYREILDN